MKNEMEKVEWQDKVRYLDEAISYRFNCKAGCICFGSDRIADKMVIIFISLSQTYKVNIGQFNGDAARLTFLDDAGNVSYAWIKRWNISNLRFLLSRKSKSNKDAVGMKIEVTFKFEKGKKGEYYSPIFSFPNQTDDDKNMWRENIAMFLQSLMERGESVYYPDDDFIDRDIVGEEVSAPAGFGFGDVDTAQVKKIMEDMEVCEKIEELEKVWKLATPKYQKVKEVSDMKDTVKARIMGLFEEAKF